jgi:multimeric flavodoxin WrbA
MGSPKLNGNTAELLKPFISELREHNCEVTYITLSDKDIRPCEGCYVCQKILDRYGCVLQDDAGQIMEQILANDYIVFATPIYAWYCTAPMKALLDRHFALNKFYGSEKGSLWKGKKIALITTHGYDTAYATEPFEMGIRRLCKHSGLEYMGMYSARDKKSLVSFQTEDVIAGARAFARQLLEEHS